MSRIFLYSLLFLFLISLETSFFSSLPFPLSLLPIVPIVGIWMYHQIPSRIGAWYLLAWGIWYDYFGLSLWSSQTVVAIGMIVVLLYASRRTFSHQSLYGLLGLAGLVWLSWVLIEATFRFFVVSALPVAFDGFLVSYITIAVELLLGAWFLFLVQVRLREPFRHL